MIDFGEACRVLAGDVTNRALHDRFGWPEWELRYARLLNPDHPRKVDPPPDWTWEKHLAAMAEERAEELLQLAAQLREQSVVPPEERPPLRRPTPRKRRGPRRET